MSPCEFHEICLQGLIRSALGDNYLDCNLTNDLVGAYDESKTAVPILCLVAKNSDPLQSILSLGETKLESKLRVKTFPLGRGDVRIIFKNFISKI